MLIYTPTWNEQFQQMNKSVAFNEFIRHYKFNFAWSEGLLSYHTHLMLYYISWINGSYDYRIFSKIISSIFYEDGLSLKKMYYSDEYYSRTYICLLKYEKACYSLLY